MMELNRIYQHRERDQILGCAKCPDCACQVDTVCEFGVLGDTPVGHDWKMGVQLLIEHLEYARDKGNPCNPRLLCVSNNCGCPAGCCTQNSY